MACSSIDGGK